MGPERRPKRIKSENVPMQTVRPNWEDGQYHESNPGQYHEVNPGQYHETNPGQYHEVNPGQYHEENPGQVDVDNVKVDFQHSNPDTRTYTVQAEAGKFLLGEVGRIDITSGQTREGVRWTAEVGAVDQARIADILVTVFGAPKQ